VRADWLVPGAFNGGFKSRVPIPSWAVMPDGVLDRHNARALELSRHWDPEVLRPHYEAVLAQ
jgi:hypothetical protein